MAQYKQPVSKGTSATDGLYTYCHIIDVDSTNMIAHVVDQLGNPRQLSITRSMGKQIELPKPNEDWIITRQYGDWMFAVCINSTAATPHYVPAGGSATSILTKVSNTDYDIQWALPVSAPTANTVPIRDANGRMQAADPSAAQDVASKNYVDAWKVPTGTVMPFAGSSAPTGFYVADGSLKSRTTDAALFAVIGTTYGVGDGSTTFGIPNLLGKVVVAMDAAETEFNTLGKTGGEKTHLLLSSEMPSHTHTATVTDPQHAHGAGTLFVTQSTVAGGNITNRVSNINTQGTTSNMAVGGSTDTSVTGITVANANTGGGGAHNNLQPYISMPYIIKR